MRQLTFYPLAGALRTWADTFFRQPMDRIHLVHDPRLRHKGLKALARGDIIFLDPEASDFTQRPNLEMLGHELTHIVQQRSGQTPEGGSIHMDLALEAQAQDWGKRFAEGGSLTYVPQGRLKREIGQPLVALAGTLLDSLNGLSLPTRKIINMIVDGDNWLNWALSDPQSRYTFPDEAHLTVGMQMGLHGTDLMLLNQPGLLVFPAALMALDEVQLEALCQLNTSKEANSAAQVELIRALLSRGLLTFEKLALVSSFLQERELAHHPLFQNMDLGNQISLYRALQGSDVLPALEPALQNEAAQFAINYAASVPEFSDYYQYYMALLNRPAFRQSSKGTREHAAQELLDQITLSISDDLRCPAIASLPNPQQLNDQLNEWIASGHQVGFPRISRGVYQLSLQDAIVHASPANMDERVNSWLTQAQTLLTQQIASDPIVAQNGAAVYYPIKNGDQNAVLDLDTGHGNLTLFAFNPGSEFMTSPKK